jgi:hypothetical protein
MRAGSKTQCLFPSYRDQSVVRIRPSAQAAEGRRSRHGHHHADRGHVHAGLVEEVSRATEDSAVVLIEPEHDPQVDGDPVAVKAGDERR